MATHPRRTKIVATIGPSSASPEGIAALIEAGMDGARMNLSHGTQADHARTAELVRAAEKDAGRSVALIADLQGPKLRVGELDGAVELEDGSEIVIAGEDTAKEDDLPITPAVLGTVLRPGADVLIDDGHVRLRVEHVERGRARCTVVVGGEVRSN
jgi:pyruvate kinase